MKKTLEQVKAEIYNGSVIEPGAMVFIAADVTDAQAMQEAGANTICLRDVSPDDFAAALRSSDLMFIIAYPEGQAAETKAGLLEAALKTARLPYYKAPPAALFTDETAYKTLKNAGVGMFSMLLSTAQNDAKEKILAEKFEQYKKRVVGGADLIDALKDRIHEKRAGIKTGFSLLDAALGDGLPYGLIVMGAIPSLGKTTYALQIADYIASSGQDVLYIALEQSAAELASKSLSRMSFCPRYHYEDESTYHKKNYVALSDLKIRTYSDPKRIDSYISRYSEGIAPNMFICSPHDFLTPDDVVALVRSHAEARGIAPVLVVDYLQILSPQNPRFDEKQAADYASIRFRTLADDIKTPIICVSSFNRMNYTEPVSLISFKESGGIEYGADVVLGFQLYGTGTLDGKNPIDPDEEKKKNPRRIEVKVLKNRAGLTGKTLYYNYYPEVSRFCEVNGPHYPIGERWEAPIYRSTKKIDGETKKNGSGGAPNVF